MSPTAAKQVRGYAGTQLGRDAALFMNRLQFGFYSVLARLDVTVDYAAVERAFLEAADT